MNRLIILLLLSGSIIVSACSDTPKEEATAETVILPDDFVDFMDEFHSELSFQKAHIQWPLQGLPTMMSESDTSFDESTFRWTEDEWIMHREFDESNEEFQQQFTLFGEDMVIEQILHINGSMGMERRFAKRDNTWNLIYYAGMNIIKK